MRKMKRHFPLPKGDCVSQLPFRIAARLLALILACSPLALDLRSADGAEPKIAWPNFRNGPDLLGVTSEQLPNSLEKLWEYPTPDGTNSTAAIADGRAYIGALSGDLICFELKDGTVVWKYHSIESADPNEFAPGFAAPIGVTGDVAMGGDEDGTFHVVDRKTGKQRWTFKTNSIINGGPNVYKDSVLFGSRDGKLYRVRLDNGEKLWEFDAGGPINATPTIAGEYTFVTGCSEPYLLVVDLETGKLHKKISIDGRIIATAAYKDEILYFGTAEGDILALDWKNDRKVWQYSMPNQEQQIDSSPAVTDKLVVIGGPAKVLLGLNRETGKPDFTFPARAKFESAPVIAGDKIVAGGADRTLYLLTLEGKQLWKFSAGLPFKGSPAVGEGRVIIGTEGGDGRIYCFGPKP
jgi:outer membrane protein assembly factor BamB